MPSRCVAARTSGCWRRTRTTYLDRGRRTAGACRGSTQGRGRRLGLWHSRGCADSLARRSRCPPACSPRRPGKSPCPSAAGRTRSWPRLAHTSVGPRHPHHPSKCRDRDRDRDRPHAGRSGPRCTARDSAGARHGAAGPASRSVSGRERWRSRGRAGRAGSASSASRPPSPLAVEPRSAQPAPGLPSRSLAAVL